MKSTVAGLCSRMASQVQAAVQAMTISSLRWHVFHVEESMRPPRQSAVVDVILIARKYDKMVPTMALSAVDLTWVCSAEAFAATRLSGCEQESAIRPIKVPALALDASCASRRLKLSRSAAITWRIAVRRRRLTSAREINSCGTFDDGRCVAGSVVCRAVILFDLEGDYNRRMRRRRPGTSCWRPVYGRPAPVAACARSSSVDLASV